jgi:aminoglycoside 2''-phosphotransferase
MNMFHTVEDINFIRQVETAALAYTKELHELTYIEHGTDNIVAIANRQFVFRFPRDERAARRIVFETALLQKIKGKLKTVPIPELLEVHTRPLYVVTKYIEGDHLTGPEIQALAEDEQHAIGVKIADFMHELNQAISGLEVRRLRTEANVDYNIEGWPQFFERVFAKELLPNNKLRPVVDEYYGTWKQFAGHEEEAFTIHDDLNPNNLLFIGPQLSGVLDFGDTTSGSIESELRKLYGCGDIVLRAAVSRYEDLTQTTIQYDHIKVWAIVHDLARFTDRLKRQDTETILFKQAQENLRNWVPNFPL